MWTKRVPHLVSARIIPLPLALTSGTRLGVYEITAAIGKGTLNHPNTAAIYGLEKTPDVTALVMEPVDGDDLSLRIARGAIPLDEALPSRHSSEAKDLSELCVLRVGSSGE